MIDVLMPATMGWLCSQCIKLLLRIIREKKITWKTIVTNGGMPSSHTATVTAMVSSVALHEGVNSSLFGVAAVFLLVVVTDAASVRMAVGQQALILNEMMAEKKQKQKKIRKKLKVVMGHTPMEIILGAMLGVIIAYAYYRIR